MTAAGVWPYTLNDSDSVVQALNVGESILDTFTVYSEDGTAQLVTVTINGRNDAAVITGDTGGSVVEAGGVGNGTPGTATATGTLTSADVDNTSAFQAVAAGAASASGHGTYEVTAGGAWTYTLNDRAAAVQALNVGNSLSDSFTVYSEDGTSELVTVTSNGRNDAAVITGTTTGSVIEASGTANSTPGTPTASGTLSSADVDNS